MGIYAIDCPSCNQPFNWFSGNPDQRCSECQEQKPIDTYTFIREYAHGIMLNANDIFAPASDSVEIDVYDLPKLMFIEAKYGHDGVVAFMAKITGCEPMSGAVGKNYEKAKQELKDYVLFEEQLGDTYE